MINIPKGTKDVLPTESSMWQFLEDIFRYACDLCGAKEIRTPAFEHTELFLRGVGEGTDVVNKEMYTFLDKGNRSITLKPEGTASVMRSFIENGMYNEAMPQKLFYITPVFRYERPQAGRLREHHQFGVEFLGSDSFLMDFEVIYLAYTFLTNLGLKNLTVNVNTIGCDKCREQYMNNLKAFYADKVDLMCEDCKRRYNTNILRMLDCKEKKCVSINNEAPSILDCICEDCSMHFNKLIDVLKEKNINFKINSKIVRGLDYYNKTVFEILTENNDVLCGGGRYDTLIGTLGGADTKAVGFGMGIERLILELNRQNVAVPTTTSPKVFVVKAGLEGSRIDVDICLELRKHGVSADYDQMNRSVKNNFKFANKIGVDFVIVIGEEELQQNKANIKNMLTGEMALVDKNKLADYIKGEK